MKVLLMVIDAASPRVVCPAIHTGRLPNLKKVADAGFMHERSITIFPSITPAATTSIATGAYPAEHGIGGASWLDRATGEVAYYGDDLWVIAKKGFGTFYREFLVHLNGDRLLAPTLFEMIEQTGRRATSVNYLVYRGTTLHRVRVPWLMALVPGVPVTETVAGPSMLCLGDFVLTRTWAGKVKDRGGPMHRFGMDDESSAAMLCQLAEAGELGDFTLAYFPDNDYRSHDVGPVQAMPVIERVDAALGAVFDACGGADRLLADTCVIVTSDHGHCELEGDASAAAIRLHLVLEEFRRADLALGWREGDEIMICPNMRAAQIYLREPRGDRIERVVRTALADARIDLAIRRVPGQSGTYIVNSQRGTLEFSRPASASPRARDAFGTSWSWRGDEGALRLLVEDGIVDSFEYPNAFERIAGALDSPNSGDVWLTARPGCEFEVPGGEAHIGGASHGALHALDSLSPVVIGGAGARVLPRAMRALDIAPLCMELLGLPMRYRVGDPR